MVVLPCWDVGANLPEKWPLWALRPQGRVRVGGAGRAAFQAGEAVAGSGAGGEAGAGGT